MMTRRSLGQARRASHRTIVVRPVAAVSVLAVLLAAAPASRPAAVESQAHAPDGALATLLLADFDDHPVGEPIGTGGAELGEPIIVDADVSAIVEQPVGMNRVLAMEADSLTTGSGVTFELLGGVGVEEGWTAFRFSLAFPVTVGVNIYVREPGGAAQAFTTLALSPDGSIVASDEAGAVGEIGAYSAAQILRFSIEHDVDAGTYDVRVNDVVLLDDRAHGVVGSGIGRLIFNFEFAQGPTRVLIDNVSVVATLPDRIFRDGFDGTVPL